VAPVCSVVGVYCVAGSSELVAVCEARYGRCNGASVCVSSICFGSDPSTLSPILPWGGLCRVASRHIRESQGDIGRASGRSWPYSSSRVPDLGACIDGIVMGRGVSRSGSSVRHIIYFVRERRFVVCFSLAG